MNPEKLKSLSKKAEHSAINRRAKGETYDRREARREQRLSPFVELDKRNSFSIAKARQLANVRLEDDGKSKPVVLLSARSPRVDMQIAAKINIEPGLRTGSYAEIKFKLVDDELAEAIKNQPFVHPRDRYPQGRVAIPASWHKVLKSAPIVATEQTYTQVYSGFSFNDGYSSPEIYGDAYHKTSGDVFNPIDAIYRFNNLRKITESVEQFEQSLQIIEHAMVDPDLNPILAGLSTSSIRSLDTQYA